MFSTQSIECPICFEIFRDPRVFKCGHTICRSCISSSLIQEYLFCPICRIQLYSDNIEDVPKNFNLASAIPEFLKLKKESDSHSKIHEYLNRQNEDLKLQIKNLKNYLEISSGKLKIAETNLHKKKQEVEKLYKDLNRMEKKQIDGKCTVHNNIIIKLEMKIEELSSKIRILISTYKECQGLPSALINELEDEFVKSSSLKERDTFNLDFLKSGRVNLDKFSSGLEIGKSKEFMSVDLTPKPAVRLPSVKRSRSIIKQELTETSIIEADNSFKFNL